MGISAIVIMTILIVSLSIIIYLNKNKSYAESSDKSITIEAKFFNCNWSTKVCKESEQSIRQALIQETGQITNALTLIITGTNNGNVNIYNVRLAGVSNDLINFINNKGAITNITLNNGQFYQFGTNQSCTTNADCDINESCADSSCKINLDNLTGGIQPKVFSAFLLGDVKDYNGNMQIGISQSTPATLSYTILASCSDGTPVNSCKVNSAPIYCNSQKNLVNDSSICGCPSGYIRNETNYCGLGCALKPTQTKEIQATRSGIVYIDDRDSGYYSKVCVNNPSFYIGQYSPTHKAREIAFMDINTSELPSDIEIKSIKLNYTIISKDLPETSIKILSTDTNCYDVGCSSLEVLNKLGAKKTFNQLISQPVTNKCSDIIANTGSNILTITSGHCFNYFNSSYNSKNLFSIMFDGGDLGYWNLLSSPCNLGNDNPRVVVNYTLPDNNYICGGYNPGDGGSTGN
jgi:hypothetical protein